MRSSTSVETGALLAAVLASKDKVIAEHRCAANRYMELYERLGRLVALHLADPEKAVEECVRLCDLEYDLAGDVRALADVADLLDPDGAAFRRLHPDPAEPPDPRT